MPSYPSFLLPTDAVKLRFREPYMSEGNNLKTSGIVPPGIYQGFVPAVGADPNVLLLNTDGTRNDSVAVADTYSTNYNITIRTDQQLQLDFTGHAIFPCWVVLRPAYSIVAHPFSGTTSAQFVTINTLTINDAVATSLHHGDIKICRVNAIPLAGNYDVTVPLNRNDNGGYLVTQTELGVGIHKIASITKTDGNITLTDTGGACVDIAGTSVTFSCSTAQVVLVFVNASASMRGQDGSTNLNLKVDGSYIASGTYNPIHLANLNLGGLSWIGGHGSNTVAGYIGFVVPVSLTSGSHTVQVGCRVYTQVGGNEGVIGASVAAPLNVSVLYF